MIKYEILDSLVGNLNIIVELFLKMAANRFAILKPLRSKLGKVCFYKKNKIDLSNIYDLLCFNFLSTSQIGGAWLNRGIILVYY